MRERKVKTMKNKKKVILGICSGIVLFVLTLMVYTVDTTEYVVVTQFGNPVSVIEDAGLQIKLPDPIQSVRRLDKRVQIYQADELELLSSDKKNVSLELETALSIVTTSYISKEDIITAIEESLPYTHHPIAEVFKRFIGRTRLINSSIKMAIRQMRQEIDDDIFHEWCDVLLECQENIGMKYTLQPIVAKYTDERIVNAELEAELAAEKSSFLMMIFLVLVNFPLLYFLNRDWFQVLVDTTQGKIVIAIVALVCFLTTLRMRKLTQPVKFKS